MSGQNGDRPRLHRIEEHIEVIFRIQRDMQQSLAAAQERIAEAQTRMDATLKALMEKWARE